MPYFQIVKTPKTAKMLKTTHYCVGIVFFLVIWMAQRDLPFVESFSTTFCVLAGRKFVLCDYLPLVQVAIFTIPLCSMTFILFGYKRYTMDSMKPVEKSYLAVIYCILISLFCSWSINIIAYQVLCTSESVSIIWEYRILLNPVMSSFYYNFLQIITTQVTLAGCLVFHVFAEIDIILRLNNIPYLETSLITKNVTTLLLFVLVPVLIYCFRIASMVSRIHACTDASSLFSYLVFPALLNGTFSSAILANLYPALVMRHSSH